MIIKISATGKSKITNENITTETLFYTTKEDFENILGKAIYMIESMGLNFVTADVYENVLSGYKNIKTNIRKNRYTTIYDEKKDAVSWTVSVHA